jgi:hypothetical protein
MFQAPPQSPTSNEVQEEEEEYYPHHPSMMVPPPPPPPPPPPKESFLDGISKTVLILIFVAFIFGLMLGKSMTPVVLRG